MEQVQVQIADQTGELLGKTRVCVSRQFLAPRVLPNANHAEARPHHAAPAGVETTKVALAAGRGK